MNHVLVNYDSKIRLTSQVPIKNPSQVYIKFYNLFTVNPAYIYNETLKNMFALNEIQLKCTKI